MTVETRTYVHDAFVSYASDDRAWVEGFLLNAFEQAGIDYHSEATFALGRPRLEEFERGVMQSRRTVVVMSNAHFADRWAELSGRLAQTEAVDSGRWSVIPVLIEPVERTGLLGVLTALDMSDAATQEERVQQLCAELGHPLLQARARPRCPYPGMAPFQDSDRHLFFGREDQIEQLVRTLRVRRFLALIGPSGSGNPRSSTRASSRRSAPAGCLATVTGWSGRSAPASRRWTVSARSWTVIRPNRRRRWRHF